MILIATPTRDSISAGTTGDLIRLCRRHPDARWASPTGIYIGNLRQSAVEIALQGGASHLLFIDSDMRFPLTALDDLLGRDAPIVAANYVMRTMSHLWVARVGGQHMASGGLTGVQSVDSVGFGVMLIQMRVFTMLERPWFDTPYENGTHTGEDLYFCRQARLAGYEILIDHDLSQQVRHIGTVERGV